MYPTTITLTPLVDGVEVYCEILHPMLNGESDLSSTNYITQVVFRLNGKIQAEFFLGKFVSKHPVIGTVFASAASGDRIEVSWQDISGNRGQASTIVT